MYPLLRRFLFMLEPEHAHDVTLGLLSLANKMHLPSLVYHDVELPTTCMGIQLPNPVGLAAGLDKNGAYIDALAQLGFGFLEVGTVTPRAQAGNDKPRLFRLKQAHGIINRMGFNNAGVDALIDNVQKSHYKGVLGINIGKNKDTPNDKALDDYVYCLERVYPYASYITINISSPNTQDLRQLQNGEQLAPLLEGIKTCQAKLGASYGFYVPIALKVAPDLDESQMDVISQMLVQFDIDGLIATNTTLSRQGVESYQEAEQAGGLSGKPLHFASTEVLAKFAQRLAGKVDVIGVGGIDTGQSAVAKIKAGASAVQLYTGLVYQGPKLIGQCLNAIGNYTDALESQML